MARDLFSKIEALLFTFGRPLPCRDIAGFLGKEEEETELLLEAYKESLQKDSERGICLKRVEDRYLLSIKQEHIEFVANIWPLTVQSKLSPAAYETLACVLYNQPVTRAQVEAVRGVNSDGIMSRLEERGLIEECGILEQPGRPSVFRVTDKFMLEVGIESKEDLKPTELLMYETIRSLEEGDM